MQENTGPIYTYNEAEKGESSEGANRIDKLKPGIYIIATPIGNMKDLSYRARETLEKLDLVACEDTRVTAKILSHYSIKAKCISFHKHSGQQKLTKLLDIASESSLGLVCDAGTPLISDSGEQLITLASQMGISITSIPGPSALTNAIALAGFPPPFIFFGFQHPKKLPKEQVTMILFESPHRLHESLKRLADKCGSDTKAVLLREMTKMHEEIVRGTLQTLLEWSQEKINLSKTHKGEVTLVIENNAETLHPWQAWLEEALKVMRPSEAAKLVSKISGARKQLVYDLALELTNKDSPLKKGKK